jgi:hypothetical protein
MDILASTSLSFVAGVAEGRSVLKHYCETNGSEEHGVIIPSLVYGLFSLPLTIVGSSPSVELVAKYSPLEIQESRDTSFQQELSTEEGELNDDDEKTRTKYSPETRKMKLGLPGPGYSQKQDEDEKLVNPAGGLNVAQMREDNRRAIAAMSHRKFQRQNQADEKFSSTDTKKKDILKRNDRFHVKGRPGTGLPTSFTENMRRSRILLLGYSIVSATIAYQEYKKNEENSSKQDNPQMRGRDSAAIQNYMNCKMCEMGVAIRILNGQNGINEMSPIESRARLGLLQQGIPTPCSLPIVCYQQGAMAPQGSFPFSLESGDNSMPFWDLGIHGKDWNELPLNRRMFFGGIDGSRRGIVFESIVSTSIKDGLLLQHRRDSKLRQAMERVDINSRKIQHAIAANGEGGIGISHIVIGTTVDRVNRSSSTDIIPCQKIFINSMDAIALAIFKSVNEILANKDKTEHEESATVLKHSGKIQSKFSETITAVQSNDEPITASNPFLIVVDSVGKHIRHGGAFVINSVSSVGDAIDSVGRQMRHGGRRILTRAGNFSTGFIKILTRSHTRNYRARINIFSDDASIASWLKGTLNTKEFQVAWHDVRNNNATETIKKDASKEEIYVILCSNDDTTIHATTSIMSTLPPKDHDRIISVIESVSARDTLKAFQGKDDNAQSICVSSIHDELFAYSKNLLIRKNVSPDKTEKIILSKLSKSI